MFIYVPLPGDFLVLGGGFFCWAWGMSGVEGEVSWG